MYFISSNNYKKQEVKTIFDKNNIHIDFLNCDLQEIQGTPEEIVQFKLDQVLNYFPELSTEDFFIEDTSLNIKAFNDFPGPYIKYIDPNLLPKMLDSFDCKEADSISVIGYYSKGKIEIFKGITTGEIVYPNSTTKCFGYDAVFKPKGYLFTFAEMSQEQKCSFYMRTIAINNLINFLKVNNKVN